MTLSHTIHAAFKSYRKDMRDIWESFNIVEYYMDRIHTQLRERIVDGFVLNPLYGNSRRTYNNRHTFGAIDSLRKIANRKRVIIESVSQFEHYLAQITSLVYREYPRKLDSVSNNSTEIQEQKLLNVILTSQDKAEIIERVIEEKIRGIFYGNPVDFFIKDKGKLEFNSYFQDNFRRQIEYYKEITARRNILIHNDGKVDRKYLREVRGTQYQLGQKVYLRDEYLQGAICILEGISAEATALIIERITNDTPKGMVSHSRHSFNHAISNGRIDQLLSNG